jgi:hypothetical protein
VGFNTNVTLKKIHPNRKSRALTCRKKPFLFSLLGNTCKKMEVKEEEKDAQLVTLECIKEKSRLRVRIISPGYLAAANCQFPRDVRLVGRKYTVPPSGVTLIKGRQGKYFYRIDKKSISIISSGEAGDDSDTPTVDLPAQVFGDDDDPTCIICMDQPKVLVLVPCGHYCCCSDCSGALKNKCPLCRGQFTAAIHRSLVQ